MNKLTPDQGHYIWEQMILAFQSNDTLIDMDDLAALEVVKILEKILKGCTENDADNSRGERNEST